ncbi:MAG: DNA (cytosine-5-)-methyltransferase [Bacteroidetes bacterium]|nr:MAG: DNA (cytosine-5-)-methyltransferase [Bacteroidota bacterium]
MKFIDLFAGLGGFHVGLKRLGHHCVFASEKKESLASLYERNFNIEVNRDITKVDIKHIPAHDILCAGFPCQPFSKAGSQEGLNDKSNGYLFNLIAEILETHRPEYFILENVRNLQYHNNGKTWKYIQKILSEKLKYAVSAQVLSPHQFGIPQHRERFFIIGSKSSDLSSFQWPRPLKVQNELSIHDYLSDENLPEFQLEEEKKKVLEVWQEFLDKFPASAKLPSWPIWSMEFGATYPFEKTTPFASSSTALDHTNGIYGIPLKGLAKEEKFQLLPAYARTPQHEFPTWKKHFIRSNRAFYTKHKPIIEDVVEKIASLGIPSYQKFEWNLQGEERNIYKHIIQFRGSGVRIKRANYFPSLVTVRTQTPVIGWKLRYITPKEGALIQSLDSIELPQKLPTAYSALGNAVNAELVYLIAKALVVENVTVI